MENPSTINDPSLILPRPRSKPNVSKLIAERKTHNPTVINQFAIQPPDKPEKLPVIQLERESPITFLDAIQENHSEVQKNLDESFMTASKWRTNTSSMSTPKNPHAQKQNMLFQTLYGKKKQFSAIKVYNHVNNLKDIPTKNFQQPQFLQFVQEAVSKSTKRPYFLSATHTPTGHTIQTTKRASRTKKSFEIKQNYTLGDHRKQLQNLETWIKTKVQTFERQQSEGESMFTDRINFMNMAFCEVSRVAGTFSTETKQIIEYLHKKYYDYYNFLTECMIEQNKKLKAEISQVEERLLKTINYYETKVETQKKESENKAEKIIINFQKCIEMRKKLERENKEIKQNLTNQQKKAKLVEQALIKVITLFLALGQKNIQEMTFSLEAFNESSKYIQSTMLAKSKKNILTEEQMEIERRKMIFQEWCGYLIKMVHRILVKDLCQKEGIDARSAVYKKQAFDVIKQYMTENDDSISPADAENILNKFLSTKDEETNVRRGIERANAAEKQAKQRELMDLEILNEKFENMYSDVVYKLPTFEEVYNRLSVNDADVQVNFKNETENSAVQTKVYSEDVGIMALPRMKTKEVDVSTELRDRILIESNTVIFNEVFEIIRERHVKEERMKESQPLIKKSMAKIAQSGYRLKTDQTINSQERQGNKNSSESGIISIDNISKNGEKRKGTRENQKTTTLESDRFIHEFGNTNGLINAEESKFKEIGVNTTISRVNQNKTVEFKVPSNLDDELNQLTLQSELEDELDVKIKSNSSIKNLPSHINTLTSLIDTIKEVDSESTFQEFNFKKQRVRRKMGFLISGNAQKTTLSQKFIRSSHSISSDSDESLDQNDEDTENPFKTGKMTNRSKNTDSISKNMDQKLRDNLLIKKQFNPSLENITIEEKQRSSLDSEFSKSNPKKKKKKNENLERRVLKNRSYVNLPNVEYATKQDAENNRVKETAVREHVIRVPKKKNGRQKYIIDPHDFHIELAFKNSQKIKFMSSITLWPPKFMSEMKKIRMRVKGIKPVLESESKTNNMVKNYLNNIVHPLLKESLKSYCTLLKDDKFDFGENLASSKGLKSSSNLKYLRSPAVQKKDMKNSPQLSYFQRLSPLLYNIINYTQHHLNRPSSENEVFFSGLKALKYKSTKLQVYYLLIEGRCVEVDIFIRTSYQFNLMFYNTNNNYLPEVNFYVLESGLFEALENYFTGAEIEKIVQEIKRLILFPMDNSKERRSVLKNQPTRRESVRNIMGNKKLDANSKICYYELLMVIFRHLREKQVTQHKKYTLIKDIISRNSQCTTYEDIMHFLRCLPIQNDKRKKILGDCLKQVVYWNSNEASVPNDVFYFILDKAELYNSNPTNITQNNDVIKQYVVNRCELYFKATLQKVVKNPEWVVNSTYILSYKIPKIFHKIMSQIRTGKDSKQKRLLHCLLTLIFCNLIDIEMEKKYMPALLNGIMAIPFS